MNPDLRAKHNASEYGLAIVTGGSSGIGYSIIEQVIKLRPELLVCNISRTKPANFLIGPQRRHLEADLSQEDHRAKVIAFLMETIAELSPGEKILLVNNAGYGFYGPTYTHPARTHLDLMELNVSAVIALTAELLPSILRQGGGIINIASTAAFQPTPSMNTYGASKAFLLHWSLGLHEELRGSGVSCVAVCPGPTKTRFHERAGLSDGSTGNPRGMSSERVARKALQALARDKALCVPGFGNALLAGFAARLPKRWATRLAGIAIRLFRSTKTKAQ